MTATAEAIRLNPEDKALVKGQYEALPYPPRDPADEDTRLLTSPLSSPVNYAYFARGGCEPDWDNLRILDAGGGTGDATVYAAVQAAGTKAEVVYLDFSAASREIAEARVARRGLENVRFVSASLLDLDKLGLGKFDLIVSSGVLHHLVDPVAGLDQLVRALKPGGVLAIMVYAKHGRYPVYPIQDLLHRVIPRDLPIEEQLRLAKAVVGNLGPLHPLNHPLIRDKAYKLAFVDDAEFLDLFLHNQDRAYSVDELNQWLDQGGAEALEPFGVPVARMHYDIGAQWKDPQLLELVAGKTSMEKAAIAELVGHATNRHIFFARKKGDDAVRVLDEKGPEAIPSIWEKHSHFVGKLAGLLDDSTLGQVMTIPGMFGYGRLTVTALTRRFFEVWDGACTVAELTAKLAAQAGVGEDQARREVEACLGALERSGQVAWRHVSARRGHMARGMGVEG